MNPPTPKEEKKLSENIRNDTWIFDFIRNQEGTLAERIVDLLGVIMEAHKDTELHKQGSLECKWKGFSEALVARAVALGALLALQREREVQEDV